MGYRCEVLADSIGPHGIRITTLEVTFPRSYLAELNTHRALSRNSESSRAIPPEKQIERVRNEPYIPDFAGRVKGMGVGDALTEAKLAEARNNWLKARDAAIEAAQRLVIMDVAKDQVNRLLEPFMWHTAIITATDWDNFFNLRDHPAAAPPMCRTAQIMKKAIAASVPRELIYGEWHLPLVSTFEHALVNGREPAADGHGIFSAHISAGRCARSSYSTHHQPETANDSVERWGRLSKAGHWSPGEHPAMCLAAGTRVGNFRGWKQLRKFYPGEAVFQG